ncbi:Exodeoxyribonuclease III [Nitrincola nitratireducens]|uniref:Exodeoxyribonuclease III n=1 Tax=Nitrincola nitratireducens TaxID=1229521 RepID=W9V103_9GAMM|nr:Exodeoxyribonuclease III [Nitrincola nitratireducens]
MKLVSFNTNSIRMRFHQLEALIAAHQPDVIGIQETKVTDEASHLQKLRPLAITHTSTDKKPITGSAYCLRFHPFL